MRTLIAKDIAPFGKILAKTDLKPILKETFFGEKKPSNNNELVIEVVYKLLESTDKVMAALFEFLAYLESKSANEIEELPLDEFTDLLKELFSSKNFGSFFKLAAR